MHMGILQTAYKLADAYGGDYNVQELGLARSLAARGHDVILYKAVDGERETQTECEGHLTIKFLNVGYLGINGLIDTKDLDTSLELLIYFSDTQLRVREVNKWCKKNNVRLFPYVGVLESHSENKLKRIIMDWLTKSNIEIYRNCTVLAKTPGIKQELEAAGCKDVHLFQVGLDESVMHRHEQRHTIDPVINVDDSLYARRCEEAKSYAEVMHLLYIGRLEAEKQPLEMLKLFEKMLIIKPKLTLTMIGDGYMYSDVKKEADRINSEHDHCINLVRKVPYKEIYKFYEDANLFINLNRVEILGMSILEAMYYECPVLAIDAPGPRFILGSEYIAEDIASLETMLRKFVSGKYSQDEINDYICRSRDRVINDFVWDSLSPKLMDIIRKSVRD